MKSMEYYTSNMTMDSNYLSIEEYLDFPIEEVVQKALETLNSVEELMTILLYRISQDGRIW